MGELGHDDANHLHRLLVRVAQRLGDVVRIEVVLMSILADKLALLLADAFAAVERTRNARLYPSSLWVVVQTFV